MCTFLQEATRSKKLLGTKGIATRNKDANSRSWHYYYSNKKLLGQPSTIAIRLEAIANRNKASMLAGLEEAGTFLQEATRSKGHRY